MTKLTVEKLFKTVNWVRAHQETVLSIAGVIAVCCGLVIYFFVHYSALSREACTKLGYAQGYASRGENDQAIKMLDEVISRHTQAKTLQYARLYKANILCRMKNYKDARGIYERLISDGKIKPVLPFAYLGLGNTLENLKEYRQAAEIYNEFINVSPEHYLIPRTYESLGRTYELSGLTNQAKQTYEKLSTLYPGTFWSRKAQERINVILQTETGKNK
jgi:tetratricopeptide (TPR) repeat protein